MGLWEDWRFAGRLLLKDKWFTLVAVVALALGIGVNATVFTFVNAVLIRGLPIADPDRTLAVGSYTAALASPSDGGQPPEPYNGAHVSANTLRVLGPRPVIGRDFVADDDV